MGNNTALTAIAIAESLAAQLQAESRVQLTRTTLMSIEKSIAQITQSLIATDLLDTITASNFVVTRKIIKDILDDPDFVETDSVIKTELVSRLIPTVEELYLKVGDYYTKNDFNYTPRMDSLIQRIVHKCVEGGMYFGVDEEYGL